MTHLQISSKYIQCECILVFSKNNNSARKYAEMWEGGPMKIKGFNSVGCGKEKKNLKRKILILQTSEG